MTLTLHELSIGLSLQSPISQQDYHRRDEWMQSHIRELFDLAKEALLAREDRRKSALVCMECGKAGDHSTEKCPFHHSFA